MGRSIRGRRDWLGTYGKWLRRKYAACSGELDPLQHCCDWLCAEYGCHLDFPP